MIVLGTAIVLSLNNSGVIGKANKAKIKSNLGTMQENATVYFSNNYSEIDMNKEYSIAEFGMSGGEYEEYKSIAVVKAGKVYIKANASEEIKKVAKELNMLIDGESSNTGSITLAKDPTNLRIYGNSLQNGTPSAPVEIESVGDKTKNLLRAGITSTVTQNGITVTYNDDGSFTVNGTATANAWFYNIVRADMLEGNESYTISCPMDGTGSKTYQMYVPKTDVTRAMYNISSGTSFVTETSGGIGVNFVVYGGNTVNNLILKPQLEEGNVATAYEPYGYKVPVTMAGKNLFDYKSVYSNFNINNGEVIATANDFHETKFYIPKQYIGKQLTFSVDVKKSEETTAECLLAYINGNMMSGSGCYTNDTFTRISITLTPETENDYLCISYGSGKSGNVYAKNFQLEEGSLATEYNSYFTPINTNIYLSEPLRKIGNIADYIDFATGEVVRYVKANDETGTMNIEKSFEELNMPVREKINIGEINFESIRNISVNTKVTPSNVEVVY